MSNNLNLSQVVASQNQKEVTINAQSAELDAAITVKTDFPVTDTNALTLTATEFRRTYLFHITEGSPIPTGAITITVPAISRGSFAVLNTTAQSVTVTITGQPVSAPVIAPGATTPSILTSDGVNVRLASSAGGGSGGSGDVVGPASAVVDRIAVYDGTTGKLIKDGGKTIAEIGGGDVVGPASAVVDRIAVFDGVTGKLIKDGGKTIAEIGGGDVVGPGSATSGNLAEFDGTTGKLLKDGGKLVANLVTGPASTTADHIATYNDPTGKILKASGILISSKAGVAVGTYNAELGFNGASVGIVYVQQSLRYTRIHDLVFITGRFQISNKGTSTGNAFITLPFTAHADGSNGGITIGGAFGMASLTSPPMSITQGSSTVTEFLHWGATGHLPLTHANFTNTFNAWISGWYRASTSV